MQTSSTGNEEVTEFWVKEFLFSPLTLSMGLCLSWNSDKNFYPSTLKYKSFSLIEHFL